MAPRTSLIAPKDHAAPSVFRPEQLLQEARRQRSLPERPVPEFCVLDPDGDLVRHLQAAGRARPSAGWACYHTELFEFALADGTLVGIVGRAVGAPFAVLVAEQLFVSGCRFLVSITSAGRIADLGQPPYAILIERALRDEGTSAHYMPLSTNPFMAAPDSRMLDCVEGALRTARPAKCGNALHRGATWTTDAPYRETAAAIASAAGLGALAVEMEAAALYAVAAARGLCIVCFAYVTNTMGQRDEGEFDKGEANGSVTLLGLIEGAVQGFRARATL